MNFSDTDIATLEAVAGLLGCQLTEREAGYRYTLPVCPDYSLHVRRDYHTQKARFSPKLPDGIQTLEGSEGINVSLNRPAPAIAKDIQRRLIPGATEWAKRSHDYTAQLKRDEAEKAEYIARIFAANRCTPQEWGCGGNWKGKGLEIGRNDHGLNYWGEYVAIVRVRSLQTLEQIAAICATDHECHQAPTKEKRHDP